MVCNCTPHERHVCVWVIQNVLNIFDGLVKCVRNVCVVKEIMVAVNEAQTTVRKDHRSRIREDVIVRYSVCTTDIYMSL